jgi:hypothetical protein
MATEEERLIPVRSESELRVGMLLEGFCGLCQKRHRILLTAVGATDGSCSTTPRGLPWA